MYVYHLKYDWGITVYIYTYKLYIHTYQPQIWLTSGLQCFSSCQHSPHWPQQHPRWIDTEWPFLNNYLLPASRGQGKCYLKTKISVLLSEGLNWMVGSKVVYLTKPAVLWRLLKVGFRFLGHYKILLKTKVHLCLLCR